MLPPVRAPLLNDYYADVVCTHGREGRGEGRRRPANGPVRWALKTSCRISRLFLGQTAAVWTAAIGLLAHWQLRCL